MKKNKKISNEETNSILSSLSNIEENDILNYNLINNCYTCNKCNLIPEIINIDYYKNIIEIKCQNHQSKMTLNEFINETLKYNYYFSVCNICNKNIQKNNNKCFKYCYDCKKIICYNCYMNHNFNHKIINQNEYNNKCPNHFNQINTSFCTDCKINICDQCKKSKMHTKHNKYDFIEIEPTEDEIAQINDFCLKFKNNLNKIEISGKKEIQEIIEFKNKRILSIYKFFQAKNKKAKEENILKINKNLQIFEKKKEELKKKYDEDLKKLIIL